MSNVLGIIAEYNPFHNGHLHHLIESKKITNSDYTIAIMSGNFTQRGEVSIVDKWEKTRMAINNGIDLVIELPTLYAISSAENFASGAIKILNSLGIVDFLSFGSESNDISLLDDIANVLAFEPAQYKTLLSHELARGESFPKARENAVMMYLNDVRRFANVLSSPNNILGIEYLKSLKRQKSKIQPITIKREGAKYNDTKVPHNSRYASATAIRNLCKSTDDITPLQKFIPETSFDILEETSIEKLDEKERFWINYYNSFYDGYNSTLGGQNNGHIYFDINKVYQLWDEGYSIPEIVFLIECSDTTIIRYLTNYKDFNSEISRVRTIERRKYRFFDIKNYPSYQKLKLTKIPVFQYSLQGEYIASYSSIEEAARILNKPCPENIGDIFRCNSRKSAYGFQWSLQKVENI